MGGIGFGYWIREQVFSLWVRPVKVPFVSGPVPRCIVRQCAISSKLTASLDPSLSWPLEEPYAIKVNRSAEPHIARFSGLWLIDHWRKLRSFRQFLRLLPKRGHGKSHPESDMTYTHMQAWDPLALAAYSNIQLNSYRPC